MRLIDADALEEKLQEERERLIEHDMLGAEHTLVHNAMTHVWDAPTIEQRHGERSYAMTSFDGVQCVGEAEDAIKVILEELKAAESDLYFALNDIKWIAELGHDDIGADEWEAVSNTILDILRAMEEVR